MASELSTPDLRALLEQERDDLRAQLADMGYGDEGKGTGLTYDSNFADSSQVTAERGEAEALANALRERLEDVEHALTKIETDRFGVCESCSKPIAPARLEAMPAVRLCIDCAAARR
jgi:DnaK suppressor protein